MEEQLDLAPCGYVVLDQDCRILEMNKTMRSWLGKQNEPSHIHEILTVASRIYFQTYFTPAILTYGKISEMHLKLRGAAETLPVLMSSAERNGKYECVFMDMKMRGEYEQRLLLAKQNAEKIASDTEKAYEKLQLLMQEVEEKQQQLLGLNEELKDMASTDTLTGLKNRRYLQEKLLRYAEEAENGRMALSVLLIDVDRFKRVNDTYGHPIGDAVLQELSWKLRDEVKEEDLIARMGGEELIIVLPHKTKEEAMVLAEHIRTAIEHGHWETVGVTISIGGAEFEKGDSIASLISKADEALYLSKKNGRNRVTMK